MRRRNECLGPVVAATLTAAWLSAWSSPARGETVCSTVDEFNALMSGGAAPTTTVSVEFDLTGVNPSDFFGGKGCLIELSNESCELDNGYASAILKVYGHDDPPNTSHPAGTLKFEYGNDCCLTTPCSGESWASPNASETIFQDGSEQCQVHVWIDPATFGYSIDCGGNVFEAVGDNDGLTVNRVSLLSLIDGGWDMPNAMSSTNEICFEKAPPDPGGPMSMTVPVLEDVTASIAFADAVYDNVADLSVGADDSEIFLKFDLGQVPGQVQKAHLFLHKADTASSEGDGGDAFFVPDNAWSEATLTWNGRPATAGASLARQSPISAFTWYAWDVSAAFTKTGVHSFAIKPQPSDQNGAHFFSREGSPSLAPYLQVEYIVVDADGDGHPAGPDCDDGNASVFPGAAEVCNGVDDDCDGAVDVNCDSAGSGASSSAGTSGQGMDDGANPIDESDLGGPSCGCRLQRHGANGGGPLLLLAACACLSLRCRRRDRSARGARGAGARSRSAKLGWERALMRLRGD